MPSSDNKNKRSDKPIPFKTVSGVFSETTETEILSDLRVNANLKFLEMSLSDPICGAVLLALTKIFQNIEWKVYNDEKNVLKDSMDNINWKDQLEDILSCLVFGHSVMETTLGEVDDGRVLWTGMYFRPQTTLTDWEFSKTGKLLHVEQTAEGKQVKIKAARCLFFNPTKSQANPLGKSLFRNAYRDWHYKTNIEKIEAIGIERDLTGVAVLSAPEDETLQDDKGNLNQLGQWAYKLVRSIKRNTQEGVVLPNGWEFELAGSPGKRQFDLNDVINRYSNNIALSMLSQFLVLGVTNSSGSFALAKEQSSLFHIAVEGIANSVANAVNTQFIGAPALGLYNDYTDKPYIKPVGIERIELNDLASFLGRLLKFNVITPDDKLEEWLRDRIALPPRDNETSRIADTKLAYEDAIKTDDNTSNINEDSPEGEDEDE